MSDTCVKNYEIGNVRLDLPYNHFIYEFPLLSFSDAMNTVGLSLIFNSNLAGSNDFYMSNGHRLNLHKRLIIQGGGPGMYENGDGSRVNLIEQSGNKYTFDDDSQRIIRGTGHAYILENPDYSKETYTTLGRLVSVTDKYGETILTYTYSSSSIQGKLTEITYRGNKVIKLSYDNNIGVLGSIKYICNGEEAYHISLAYDGTSKSIVTLPSGVVYRTSYYAGEFEAYSGTKNSTNSHRVTCVKTTDSITVKRYIGTSEVDKTLYGFVGYDETNGINILDVTDFQGVTTRVQYENKKAAYSYERMDFILRSDENPLEKYYPGTITYYNNENAVGSQKYNDGFVMTRNEYNNQVVTNEHFSVRHSLTGIITVSGWLLPKENISQCTIRLSTESGFAQNYTVRGLMPGVWKYFAVSTYATDSYPYVEALILENTEQVFATDFRVTAQVSLTTDGNVCKNNIIGVADLLFYKDTDGQEYAVPLDTDVKFLNGNTELSSDTYPITYNDLLKYKINQMIGTSKNEIYYNNCRGVISGAGILMARFKKTPDDTTEISSAVTLLSIGKRQETKNRVIITKNSSVLALGETRFKTESFVNSDCFKSEIYDSRLDLIESTVDGITTTYTRKEGTSLITNQRVTTADDAVGITTSASYDSNNCLIKTTNEFGKDTFYTIDTTWGTVSVATNALEMSITDTYNDDRSVMLSRKFKNGEAERLHSLCYADGRLSSLECGSIKYLFGHTVEDVSEYSKTFVSTVSKGTADNVIETVKLSEDQTTASAFYPKSGNGMIYSVTEHTDEYGRLTEVEGKITNSYALDSYYDVDALTHKTVNIDNASSKLISTTDLTTGSTKTFMYEKDMIGIITNSSPGSLLPTNEQYFYDSANRLTRRIIRFSESYKFENLIEYANEDTAPLPDSRISSFKWQVSDGTTLKSELETTYDYDSYKRVTKKSAILSDASFIKSFDYTTTRLTSVSDKLSGNNKGSNAYTYDDLGRILTDTYSSDSASGYTRYTYDGLGQIIREDNEALDKTFIYCYDSIGNISAVKTYGYTLGGVDENGYDSIVESEYSTDRLTKFGTKSISYNSLGYPTNYDGKNYQWTKGRLTRIYKGSESQPGSKFETCNFTYDAYGRRKRKYYNYDPNTSVSGDGHYYYGTDYTYDESGRLVKEFITEYRDTGTTRTRELVYLYDESGIMGVMYTYNGGTAKTYYYRKNAQGDVTAIYNAAGTRLAEYAYDAFGNCTIIYGSSATIAGINPIRYRSYYFDRETGLYYLNARYYNPQWRRFISPDSTSYLNPATPNGLNLYCYCYNDPVNYADPSGHMPFWLAAGLVVAGIGLIGGATYAGISSYNAGNTGWNLAGDIALGGLIGGVAGFGIGALIGAGAAALFAGNFIAETATVFVGVTYAFEMLSASGITATMYMLGDNITNSLSYRTHIFWAGQDVASNSANNLANAIGGTTISMTKLGNYLETINASRTLWEIASKNFANQVPQNGVVYAVLYPPLMSKTPIWYIEQKVLESHFVNIIEITIQAIQ